MQQCIKILFYIYK